MSDYRDTRGGACDHVNDFGNSQPPQVRDTETPHQKAQWGADVRPEPLPGPEEVYPGDDRRGNGTWTANARIRATLAGMNNAVSRFEKLSAATRRRSSATRG